MALALRIAAGFNGVVTKNSFKIANTLLRTSPLARSTVSKCVQRQIQPIRTISTSTPRFSAASGHHTALWTAERALSVALLGIIPAAFIFPSQGLDAVLAASIIIHGHWGLEAIVTDYVRPILFGNVVPKVAHGALLLLSMATLGGLLYFVYNDIGIAKAVRKLWAIKGQ